MHQPETLLSLVETLSTTEIDRVIKAIDAQTSRLGISLMAQLTLAKQAILFSGEAAPMTSAIIPKENFEQKRAFYLAIARRLVNEWRADPNNDEKRIRIEMFISYTAYELYYPQASAQSLRTQGYDVAADGLATGINQEFSAVVEDLAQSRNIDLQALEKKIGGLTFDILDAAKQNLQLSVQELQFLEDVILAVGASERGKANKLQTLRIAQESRKYYLEAGLTLDELTKMWGINRGYQSTTQFLQHEAVHGQAKTKLVNEATTSVGKEQVLEAEAFSTRAQALGFPTERLGKEEVTKRNAGILQRTQQIMQYREITGKTANPKNFILFSGPGARQRAVNFTYETQQGMMNNIQILHEHMAAERLGSLSAHEFTHELQGYLVGMVFGGIEAWNKVNSGIKEQLAIAVEDSMNAILQKENTQRGGSNGFMPALITWYQYAYGYCQQRFLEEVYKGNCALSDEQLLAIDQQITSEVTKINILRNGDKSLDLTRVRRMAIDMVNLPDGIVYTIHHLNKAETPVVTEVATPEVGAEQKKEEATLNSLLVGKWGAEWLQNISAYKYVLCVMIESANCNTTEEVVYYMAQLLERGDAEVEEILKNYGVTV